MARTFSRQLAGLVVHVSFFILFYFFIFPSKRVDDSLIIILLVKASTSLHPPTPCPFHVRPRDSNASRDFSIRVFTVMQNSN